MRRLLIQAAAVLLASSVPASAQAPTAGEEVVVWSATRKLDWKDFKAKPEGGALGGARIAISEVQTEHGQIERQQNDRERRITAQLEELKAFSDG